jgi:hypothetical protein
VEDKSELGHSGNPVRGGYNDCDFPSDGHGTRCGFGGQEPVEMIPQVDDDDDDDDNLDNGK